MAKTKTRFLCKECGAVQPKWMGKCPDCGSWDALEEFRDAGTAAASDPYTSAAPPEEGDARVLALGDALADLGIPIARGQFGADMKVALINDGPVTIWLDVT